MATGASGTFFVPGPEAVDGQQAGRVTEQNSSFSENIVMLLCPQFPENSLGRNLPNDTFAICHGETSSAWGPCPCVYVAKMSFRLRGQLPNQFPWPEPLRIQERIDTGP